MDNEFDHGTRKLDTIKEKRKRGMKFTKSSENNRKWMWWKYLEPTDEKYSNGHHCKWISSQPTMRKEGITWTRWISSAMPKESFFFFHVDDLCRAFLFSTSPQHRKKKTKKEQFYRRKTNGISSVRYNHVAAELPPPWVLPIDASYRISSEVYSPLCVKADFHTRPSTNNTAAVRRRTKQRQDLTHLFFRLLPRTTP